jgi:hypothetical protein
MSIKASVYSGPTNVMALGHPFGGPAYADSDGIPIGIDVNTRELVCVDFWQLRKMHIINTKFGIVFGDVGFGKSTLLKILAIRTMILSAGFSQMRTLINDYKPEADESEYGRFSNVVKSTIFKMAEMKFNPFEARLFNSQNGRAYELGLLDMARVIAEFSKKGDLQGYQFTALRIALSVMLNMPEALWDPPLLFKIVGSLTTEQVNDYHKNLDERLKTQMQERLSNLVKTKLDNVESWDEEGRKETTSEAMVAEDLKLTQAMSLASAADNYYVGQIQSAGSEVQTMGYDLLEGPVGAMIGHQNSLYDLYSQRATTKDWRGLLPEVQRFARIIDNNFRIAMIEGNRSDLLPFIELDDEKHKSMDDITYARVNAFTSEIARGTHMVSLSASHRPDSIRKGAVGSELWKLGETIINNQGFAFLGHQQNVPGILNELGDRYRLGDFQNDLPYLPQYTFIATFGPTEPVRKIRVFVTPLELEMIQTDSATDIVVARPDVMNQDDLRRYALANGVAYIGGEM